MEAIRNYLEDMFANLPNTAEVQKAKLELLQMMEDKYTSLLEEGKKENEAVGIVISEFGNLNEISETLGISNVMEELVVSKRRNVSREEAEEYVTDHNRHSFMIGFGVMLCIISPLFPVLFGSILPGAVGDAVGVSGMFADIAIAVAIFIIAGVQMKKWDFLKKELCSIDYRTADSISREQKLNEPAKTIYLVIGILLCIVWIIPISIVGALPFGDGFSDVIIPMLLFIMVGIGVLLIIFSSGRDGAYKVLLRLNDKDTVAGNYDSTRGNAPVYENETLNNIMSVYWFTVRSVYLIWSFLTFAWYKTWIIWPLAAIAKAIIDRTCAKKEVL